MRLLISRDAPFDRYAAGDMTAIDASAKRGLKLFIGKAACVECHDGPHFDDSDDNFRVNGLRPEGSQVVPEETGRQFVIDYILANPIPAYDRHRGALGGRPAHSSASTSCTRPNPRPRRVPEHEDQRPQRPRPAEVSRQHGQHGRASQRTRQRDGAVDEDVRRQLTDDEAWDLRALGVLVQSRQGREQLGLAEPVVEDDQQRAQVARQAQQLRDVGRREDRDPGAGQQREQPLDDAGVVADHEGRAPDGGAWLARGQGPGRSRRRAGGQAQREGRAGPELAGDDDGAAEHVAEVASDGE